MISFVYDFLSGIFLTFNFCQSTFHPGDLSKNPGVLRYCLGRPSFRECYGNVVRLPKKKETKKLLGCPWKLVTS